MTAQWVSVDVDREQGLDGRPDGIAHFGVERAHDNWNLHSVVWWLGKHPESLGATTTTGGWFALSAGKA